MLVSAQLGQLVQHDNVRHIGLTTTLDDVSYVNIHCVYVRFSVLLSHCSVVVKCMYVCMYVCM